MNDQQSNLAELKQQIREFTTARDWEQFHDLKNLSMALAIEAAELMEHFRWVNNADANAVMQNEATAKAVREEVADVLLLLTSIR